MRLLATNTPSVFHCTAGKDRTFFAAALILMALELEAQERAHLAQLHLQP